MGDAEIPDLFVFPRLPAILFCFVRRLANLEFNQVFSQVSDGALIYLLDFYWRFLFLRYSPWNGGPHSADSGFPKHPTSLDRAEGKENGVSELSRILE